MTQPVSATTTVCCRWKNEDSRLHKGMKSFAFIEFKYWSASSQGKYSQSLMLKIKANVRNSCGRKETKEEE